MNVRSPREELDGVVDVDVVAEAVVADCLRWVRLLERDGARLVAGPYIWFALTGGRDGLRSKSSWLVRLEGGDE